MDEILTFSGTGKLNLAAALKQTQLRRPQAKPKSKKWSSSTNSDSGSSCGEGTPTSIIGLLHVRTFYMYCMDVLSSPVRYNFFSHCNDITCA